MLMLMERFEISVRIFTSGYNNIDFPSSSAVPSLKYPTIEERSSGVGIIILTIHNNTVQY